MRSTFVSVVGALLFTASLSLWSSVAQADVAPGPEEDENAPSPVDYAFTVHGVKNPDIAVFAYPCSGKQDGPVDDIMLVKDDTQLNVGRNGGACTLYMTPKVTWDAFAKTYTPANLPKDPILEDFASKATRCDGHPTPTFDVYDGSSSPGKGTTHGSLSEDLDMTELTATNCTVTSRGFDPSKLQNVGSSSSDSGHGCSVGGRIGSAGPWLIALTVPVIVLGSRRRKNKKEKKAAIVSL